MCLFFMKIAQKIVNFLLSRTSQNFLFGDFLVLMWFPETGRDLILLSISSIHLIAFREHHKLILYKWVVCMLLHFSHFCLHFITLSSDTSLWVYRWTKEGKYLVLRSYITYWHRIPWCHINQVTSAIFMWLVYTTVLTAPPNRIIESGNKNKM